MGRKKSKMTIREERLRLIERGGIALCLIAPYIYSNSVAHCAALRTKTFVFQYIEGVAEKETQENLGEEDT